MTPDNFAFLFLAADAAIPPEERIINLVIGPAGAIVLALIVLWALWKLYREERTDRKQAEANLAANTEVIKDLTGVIRTFIEDIREETPARRARTRTGR